MTRFRNRFGSLSADGREYIITSPRTPRPWINVISNGDYGLALSQAGGGYSWRTHGQINRITRWEQDLIRDDWGKFVYLRDEKGNTWSAGWKPVCRTPDFYRCTHGFGYTTIESLNFGIQTTLTVFVPFESPVELWILKVQNETRRRRTIDVLTYCEWALGRAPDWHREFHKSFMSTTIDQSLHAIFAGKTLWEVPGERGHWNVEWPYVAFHSCSIRPVSAETEKEAFLGMYGNLNAPQALDRKKLSNKSGRGVDAIASLHTRLTLKAREEQEIVFTLGASDTHAQAVDRIKHYRDPENARRALDSTRDAWAGLLGTTTVDSPDPAMNVMQNGWLKYQAISGRLWGRSAYYQTGGAYGFRDQLQDSLIWLVIDPGRTFEQIRLHARHQFRNGSVYHWWHPLTEEGLRTQISDNLLWLPFVVHQYLLETGNLHDLDARDPWADDSAESSLFDHCMAAIDHSLGRLSARGLPLIGSGDWNDGLSAVGLDMKGESVWLGHFLYGILRSFSEICLRCGKPEKSAELTGRADYLKERLNTIGWDGRWYSGATKDSGAVIGSGSNAEGSLWLNPQTWSILAGVADKERASQVMDIVERELEGEAGPLLLKPAYSTPDSGIGYLTRYAPGLRENGGVYTHAATWAVAAAARLGRGKAAYRMYSKLNPLIRSSDPQRYASEPYVTAGNIEGPDSMNSGRGGWTWYSGSAAWLFRVGMESIMGLRPLWEGLAIDPCVPSSWKRFRVKRVFRGSTYHIEVSNPESVECGVARVLVNGTEQCAVAGARQKVIPPPSKPGSTIDVQVTMGTVA